MIRKLARSRLVTAALASVATAVLVGGVALASIPSTGTGEIHACYSKSSGQLRVIDVQRTPPQSCGTKELPLQWNEQGPEGLPGTPGADGEDGVSGYQQISAQHFLDPGDSGVYVASCPTGKVALGAGYQRSLGVTVVESYPNGQQWEVRAANNGTTQNESLIIQVQCASI